jgi:hypothetical protein
VKDRISSWYLIAGVILVVASISVVVAQTRTPATDFKIRYKVTMSGPGMPGQDSETITMIKKARERSENHTGHGFDSVTITQCDLKRTIQLSDSAKKYVITPMDTGEPAQRTTPGSPAPAPTTPTRQGGTVEYVTSAIDTGERKEMFGFTARHVKTMMSINASPDSCSPGKRKIELDGWYIDLSVEFSCDVNKAQAMTAMRPSPGGCKDKVTTRREGNAKTGFPLIETMRMYGDDGQVTISQTREVVELSRATLDMALFDIPAGYTEAASTSELYVAPSIASMMNQAQQPNNPITAPASVPSMSATGAPAKKPGTLLIGVVQFNNKAGRQVSLFELRQRLITQLEANGTSAIALNASSQMEADVEAKAKQCDFVLYTDVAALKVNKLGGMFGSIAGVGGAAKTEAKLEFRLLAVGETTPRLKSSASAKEEGEENSAGAAIDTEARMVAAEVKKPR